jgi:glycosyltransferase involved in cell wall biosynthesis
VLVRAAAQLDGDVVVVLVGHAEPYAEALRAIAAELVSRAGFASSTRCRTASSRALAAGRLLCLPDARRRLRDFPLLEAMDHGLAVACSDLPVLREVGGELPVFFDPHSPEDAARAIRLALSDKARAARGPAHAAQFTWERAAQGTYSAYERALVAA